MNRNRSIAVLLALSLVALAAGIAAALDLAPPKPADVNAKYVAEVKKAIDGREKEPAEKVFKDVEIFKGWTAGAVLNVMDKSFAPALGVTCTHCHKDADWAADNKKKKIAREMWTMMIDTNRKIRDITWGDGSINCYTCHRGQREPATSPHSND